MTSSKEAAINDVSVDRSSSSMHNTGVLNAILLFIYALSGVCATPDTFGDALNIKELNTQQLAAQFSKSKDNDCLLLTISPYDKTSTSLIISMEDMEVCNPCHITVYRNKKTTVPLATTTITRSHPLQGYDRVNVTVHATNTLHQFQRYTSLSFFSNAEMHVSQPLAEIFSGDELLAKITYPLPTHADGSCYVLSVLTDLDDLPQFTVALQTHDASKTISKLKFDAFTTTPKVLV